MSTVVITECPDTIRKNCGRYFYVDLKVEVFDIQILEICFELDNHSSCKFILAVSQESLQVCRDRDVKGYNGPVALSFKLRLTCPPDNIYYPTMAVKASDKTNPHVNDSTTIQLEIDCRR